MRRNYWIIMIAFFCFGVSLTEVSIFSDEHSLLTVIGVALGGIVMFVAGMSEAQSDTAGKPIPLNMLRTQEPFLVTRRDDTYMVQVAPLWERDQIRVVEWLPYGIGKGDVFIVKKDGTVSVISGHPKEEEIV